MFQKKLISFFYNKPNSLSYVVQNVAFCGVVVNELQVSVVKDVGPGRVRDDERAVVGRVSGRKRGLVVIVRGHHLQVGLGDAGRRGPGLVVHLKKIAVFNIFFFVLS